MVDFGACERCARSPGSAPARPASAPPATVRGGTLSTAAGHAAVTMVPAHAALTRFFWRVRAGTGCASPEAAEGPRAMPAAPEAPQPPRDGGTVAPSSSPLSSHHSHPPTYPSPSPQATFLPSPVGRLPYTSRHPIPSRPHMSSRAVLYAYRGSCVVWCFVVFDIQSELCFLGVAPGSPGPRRRSRHGGLPGPPGAVMTVAVVTAVSGHVVGSERFQRLYRPY